MKNIFKFGKPNKDKKDKKDKKEKKAKEHTKLTAKVTKITERNNKTPANDVNQQEVIGEAEVDIFIRLAGIDSIDINRSLYSFLTEDDAKKLRAISKTCLRFVRSNQSIPYRSKTQFLLGFSLIYTFDAETFKQSWTIYKSVMESNDTHPAVFYKLGETNKANLNIRSSVLKGSVSTKEGYFCAVRMYQPKLPSQELAQPTGRMKSHNWPKNFAWMIGNLHLGRAVFVCSPLTDKNLMRSTEPTHISALASEIAIALKAGYKVELIVRDCIMLSPPNDRSSRSKAPQYFRLNTEVTKDIYKKLYQSQNQFFTVNDEIKTYLHSILENNEMLVGYLQKGELEFENIEEFVTGIKGYLAELKRLLKDEAGVKYFYKIFPIEIMQLDAKTLLAFINKEMSLEQVVDKIIADLEIGLIQQLQIAIDEHAKKNGFLAKE